MSAPTWPEIEALGRHGRRPRIPDGVITFRGERGEHTAVRAEDVSAICAVGEGSELLQIMLRGGQTMEFPGLPEGQGLKAVDHVRRRMAPR